MVIGSRSSQIHVTSSPTWSSSSRSPLATAVVPSGTVISNRHVALSDGWSDDGSHALAPSGSFNAYEPSSVSYQPTGNPASIDRSLSGAS